MSQNSAEINCEMNIRNSDDEKTPLLPADYQENLNPPILQSKNPQKRNSFQNGIALKGLEILEMGRFLENPHLASSLNRKKSIFKDLGLFVYVFEVTSADFSWKYYLNEFILVIRIWKRLKDFSELLPCIEQIDKNSEPSKKTNIFEEDKGTREFLDLLTDLLNQIANLNNSHPFSCFEEFCEISGLSYKLGTSQRFKEGYIKKRSGGRFKQENRCCYCGKCCRIWTKKWFIVTDDFVAYLRDSTHDFVHEVMLYDSSFTIISESNQTGGTNRLIIQNNTRALRLQMKDPFEKEIWKQAIELAYSNSSWMVERPFSSFAPIRTNSLCSWFVDGKNFFSAVYKAMLNAKKDIFITDWWLSPKIFLERPVSITNPEIKKKSKQCRLDEVIRSKAEKGIKIYVLLFKEVEMALPLKSLYSKQVLQKKHPNIKVIRHPRSFISLWSHHEKIVIVDQEIGFVGGLDLCFGRWDTNQHLLEDPPLAEDVVMFPGQDYCNVRIADYKNVDKYKVALIDRNFQPRMPWHDIAMMVEGEPVKDLVKHFIEYWNHAKIDASGTKKKTNLLKPRFSTKGGVIGENIRTYLRATDQNLEEEKQQNMNLKESLSPEQKELLLRKSVIKKKNTMVWGDLEKKKSLRMEINEEEKKEDLKNSFQPLESIAEEMEEEKDELGSHIANQSNISAHKISTQSKTRHTVNYFKCKTDLPKGKMPKKLHSISLAERGTEINFLAMQEATEDIRLQIPLMPDQNQKLFEETYRRLKEKQRKSKRVKIKNWLKKKIGKEPDENKEKKKLLREAAKQIMSKEEIQALKNEKKELDQDDDDIQIAYLEPKFTIVSRAPFQNGHCNCQVLRSASPWSLGLPSSKVECSIYNAYIDLIQTSVHFIYIENQFFISATKTKQNIVKNGNRIANALAARIIRAHQNDEIFRVFVCIPLMPGFEGDVAASNAAVLRVQLHYEYHTIDRGDFSLCGKLRNEGIDPKDYIIFCGLRNHGMINEVPKTELIYIHSKLMIVDDKYVIIGSANINDRSMLGSRDSEIAILTNDEELIDSKMNNNNYLASKFAQTLRIAIYKEHLGIENDDDVIDPISDTFWRLLWKTAKTNAVLYRKMFACYPDNKMKSYANLEELRQQYNNLTSEEKSSLYLANKDLIRGHLVIWPTKFLCKENLSLGFFSVENILPERNFT